MSSRTVHIAYDHLSNRYFLMALAAAVFVHLSALLWWAHMPHVSIVDVPVRALNIKLGDGDALEPDDATTGATHAGAAPTVQDVLSHFVHDMAPQQPTPPAPVPPTPVQAPPTPTHTAAAKVPEKTLSAPPRQFVREAPAVAAGSGSGQAAGNSKASNAEIAARYEQLISLWVQKFKVYPDNARVKGLQGKASVRIRIDRRGNVLYYILEQSTGYQQLDRAALDMVVRANPVPPVPKDYSPSELNEFVIPVNFSLQE